MTEHREPRVLTQSMLLGGAEHQQLARIETKVDDLTALVAHLLRLLAEDSGEELAERTLDGELDGGERDQSQSL